MKKVVAGFLAMVVIATSMIGCSDQKKPYPSEPPQAQAYSSLVEYNMNSSEVAFLDKTIQDYYTNFNTIDLERFNSFYMSDASASFDKMKESMDLYGIQNVKLRQTGGHETYENYAFLYAIYDMKIGNGSWMPTFEFLVLEKKEGNWKMVTGADVEELTQSWIQSRTIVERDNTWFASIMNEIKTFNENEFNKQFLETIVPFEAPSVPDTTSSAPDEGTEDSSQAE